MYKLLHDFGSGLADRCHCVGHLGVSRSAYTHLFSLGTKPTWLAAAGAVAPFLHLLVRPHPSIFSVASQQTRTSDRKHFNGSWVRPGSKCRPTQPSQATPSRTCLWYIHGGSGSGSEGTDRLNSLFPQSKPFPERNWRSNAMLSNQSADQSNSISVTDAAAAIPCNTPNCFTNWIYMLLLPTAAAACFSSTESNGVKWRQQSLRYIHIHWSLFQGHRQAAN